MIPSPPCAFLTGAPGPGEWVVLFLVILVLFGPRRLPEIARTIGRVLEQLRRASGEFREQVMRMDESPVIDLDTEAGDASPAPGKGKGEEGSGPSAADEDEAGDGTAEGTEGDKDAADSC